MRNSWRAAAVAALLAGACSSGGHNAAPGAADGGTGAGAKPSTPTDGGDGNAAGAGTSSGGSGAVSSGDAGEAAVAGHAGAEGGAGGDNTAGTTAMAGAGEGGDPPYVEPFPDPVCQGTAELGDPVKLPISTLDDDQFGGVSADELVIVWTVMADDKVTLHYARRDDKLSDFGNEGTLELTSAADDSVTVSPDGLRVVYTSSDRKGFTQLVRSAVDEAFGTVDSFDFSVIADDAQQFAEGEALGDPVLGQDSSTFFYSRYGAGRTKTLLRTLRFSQFAPWPPGTELAVAESLEASGDDRKRPTGVSVDGQSLFVWDKAADSQKVAVQSHETAIFDVAFELDDARGAAPNGACSRVYFDRDGDLWSAALR